MSPYYTRKGDDGTTSWIGKGRIDKFDLRLEALGTLDETSAFLGLARTQVKTEQIKVLILQIQRDLNAVMAEVAADPNGAAHFRTLQKDRVTWLEEQTDALTQSVGLPGEFLIPGDTVGGGALDVVRTVIRRAERRVVELHHTGGITNILLLSYMNRLSSLLFVMELLEIKTEGIQSPNLARKSSLI
jgi:cob(I)alamin adenosyltransferase